MDKKSSIKCFILAAGFGTRLAALTAEKPKALVEIAGQTMLEYLLNRIDAIGIEDVIINSHYLADKLRDFVQNKEYNLQILNEPAILDVGGAIKNVFDNTDTEVILAHNVDAIFCGREVLSSFIEDAASQLEDGKDICLLLYPKSHYQLKHEGDFTLNEITRSAQYHKGGEYIYCGVALIAKRLVRSFKPGNMPFIKLLQKAKIGYHIISEHTHYLDAGTEKALVILEELAPKLLGRQKQEEDYESGSRVN